MRATRSGVGGTTGRPSLQPRSYIASISSSRVAELDAAATAAAVAPAATDARRRRSSGSWVREPQPGGSRGGRRRGRSTPVSCLPLRRAPSPTVRSTTRRRRSSAAASGTVSMSSANDTLEVACRRRGVEAVGKRRVVLRVDGERLASPRARASTGATSSHVGQSRLTTATSPSGSATVTCSRSVVAIPEALDEVVDGAGEGARRRRARSPGTARCAAGCGRACGTARRRRCRSRAAPPRCAAASTASSKSMVAVTWLRSRGFGDERRRELRSPRPSRRGSRPTRSQRPAAHSSPPLPSIHSICVGEQEERRERGRVVGLVEARVLERDREVERRRDPAAARARSARCARSPAGEHSASHRPPSLAKHFCGAK